MQECKTFSPRGRGRRGQSRLAEFLEPDFFGALCDPSRLWILARLVELKKPSTVGEIAACCPTSLSVVSRHLSRLRDAGIIAGEKRGREVYYRVRTEAVAQTLRGMADAMERCCPPHGKSKSRRGKKLTQTGGQS